MFRFALGSCCLLLGLGACKGDKNKSHKLHRSDDGNAVVIVDEQTKDHGLPNEIEPNDQPEEGKLKFALTEANPRAGVQGILNGHLDVDSFACTVQEETFLFASLEGASDADLKLELFGPKNKRLALSDRGPAKVSEGLAGFWLDPNVEYRVVVSEFTKRSLRKKGAREGKSKPYLLRLEAKSMDEGFEQEPNGDGDGAMELIPGDDRYGYIGWTNDSDLWRVPIAASDFAPEEGSGSSNGLDFVVSGIPTVRVSLSLLDADSEVLATVQSRKGGEAALRNVKPDPDAEFYYLRVKAKRSNPLEMYVLKLSSVVLPKGREEEPNTRPELATLLTGGDGELMLASGELSRKDIDWFKIPATKGNRVLDFQMKGIRGASFAVEVLGGSGAVMAQAKSLASGQGTSLNQVNIPAGVSPLLKIVPTKISEPSAYSLSVSVASGTAAAVHASVVPAEPLVDSTETPE